MKTEIGELLIIEQEGQTITGLYYLVLSLRTQKYYVVTYGPYFVTLIDGGLGLDLGWYCTCKDHLYRKNLCKHILHCAKNSKLNPENWPF
jgi:hypothetical protein